MTEAVDEPLAKLHEHLEATQSLPVEREASRWIGEAEAVVSDLVYADVDESVVEKRVAHVVELLGHVEETGDEAADEHVRAARGLAERILEAVDA
ncbi:hypothetical protein ACYJ1Y_03125 [Natrialbaceae archaeon A-gly3]